MKKFIKAFLQPFHIEPELVRIGVAKYSDSPNLEFDLTTYSDAKQVEKAVENIKQEGGGTMTGEALEFMGPYFEEAIITRAQVPKYLVVITDGKSSDKVKVPADKLRAKKVNIFAVGVKEADENQLQEIAGGSKGTFRVNNFDGLKTIKDDIITGICAPDSKCMSNHILFMKII